MAVYDFNDPAQRARALENEKHTVRIRNEAKRAVAAEERGTAEPPEIVTLRELLLQPEDETPWRITNVQPTNSRVICAAQFKAGKTTLVGNLIRSLCDGDTFLGRYKVEPIQGTVALLDFEMGRGQLKRWYQAQQIENSDSVIVLSMRGRAASFNLLDPEVRAGWVALFRKLSVRYLIIDCLRPILDALGLDEHHDVGAFLVPLDALLADACIPDALVVHHMGHANERSRGDSRLRDWPDVEWRLMRKDEDPASARFFTAYGRDVDITEQELSYDPATRQLTVVGGSRRDMKISEALPAVLAFIAAAEEPPSQRDILSGLSKSDHSRDVLREAIKAGIASGQIAATGGKQGAQLHSIITTAYAPRAYAQL